MVFENKKYYTCFKASGRVLGTFSFSLFVSLEGFFLAASLAGAALDFCLSTGFSTAIPSASLLA